MVQQNQLIAIQKGTAKSKDEALTSVYHAAQKPALFEGMLRHFAPLVDGGEEEGKEFVPDEATNVQFNCQALINLASTAWIEHVDVLASKDYGNCDARADVKIGDLVLVENAPVTFLLALEKELVDMRTLIEKLPTLDNAVTWHFDQNVGLFRSDVERRQRLVKEEMPIVMYEATDKHPAQTQMIKKDVVVGHWEITRFSGAITGEDKRETKNRLEELVKAVKMAREEANSVKVNRKTHIGDALSRYLFKT